MASPFYMSLFLSVFFILYNYIATIILFMLQYLFGLFNDV